jgi:soluble lytic murein transglycosylase-like protein
MLRNAKIISARIFVPALAAVCLFLAPRACAQTAYGNMQSPQAAAPAASSEEYARIEMAYTQVVKYYNKKLPDNEALRIARCILYYSNYYKLDPRLVVAVIVQESRFNPSAVSHAGAQGLGQLMPGTARYLGVSNSFDVQQNIYGTVRYLREQYDRFQSNPNVLDYMLAAYNAGPEAVAKYKGVPPYKETRNYVVQVKKLYKYFMYGS